ncbi:MAG: hypothetical protein AVDCRST_MAG06-247, partial [uncultured Nocardioides sp.]
ERPTRHAAGVVPPGRPRRGHHDRRAAARLPQPRAADGAPAPRRHAVGLALRADALRHPRGRPAGLAARHRRGGRAPPDPGPGVAEGTAQRDGAGDDGVRGQRPHRAQPA